MKLLTFELRGMPFGMPIDGVREIVAVGDVAPLPRSPAALSGVMNLRGHVVAVVDLGARIGLDDCACDPSRHCIVVLDVEVEGERVPAGVRVDAVQEVIEVAAQAVLPPPGFGTRVAARYLAGLVERAPFAVSLLDMRAVLDPASIDAEIDAAFGLA